MATRFPTASELASGFTYPGNLEASVDAVLRSKATKTVERILHKTLIFDDLGIQRAQLSELRALINAQFKIDVPISMVQNWINAKDVYNSVKRVLAVTPAVIGDGKQVIFFPPVVGGEVVIPPPVPVPNLQFSPSSAIVLANVSEGSFLFNIVNVPAGATPVISPNDGRAVVAGNAANGWKVVRGLSAISAGDIPYTVSANGAIAGSGMLTVLAVSADTKVNLVSRIPAPGTQSNSPPAIETAPSVSTLSATSTRATIVDPTTTYQTYRGMGVQLQHATEYNLNRISPAAKDEVLTRAFGDGKINYVRAYLGSGAFVAIYKEDGSTDYSTLTGPVSDTTPQDETLPGFTMVRQKIEVNNILKAAFAKNPNIKVFLSVATPPAWMKTGYNTTQLDKSKKLAVGTGGTMNSNYFRHYANYIVRGMQEMIADGCPIFSFCVQNEPANTGTYPTCLWSAAQIVAFIRDFLWPAMGVAGLQYIEMWAGEVNLVDATKYVDPIVDGSGMAGIIKGASYHNYSGPMSNMRYAKYPDLSHNITEYRTLLGQLDPNTNVFTPASNRTQAQEVWNNMVMESFRNGAASSAMFVLALDETGAPSNNNLYRRGVVTVPSDGSAVKYNQEFYMLTQVARYTQPGGKRIDSNQGGGIANVMFLNPDGTTTAHFFNTSSTAARTTDVIDAVSGKVFPLTLNPLEAVAIVFQTAAVSGSKAAQITGLAAAGSASQVALSWNSISDANRKGIVILRRTGTAAFSPIATLKADEVGYIDTTVGTGTTYDYQVQAIGNGRATVSNTATALTSGSTAPVLGQITLTLANPPRDRVPNTITVASGRAVGSTIKIAVQSGELLDASSGSVAWTPGTFGPDSLTPIEELSTASNSPFTSDPLAVDVAEATQRTLQNLSITFPSKPKVGQLITGTVGGAADGSTITILTQGGTTINVNADRTFSYTPTTAGSRTLAPTETLAGATNSPYPTNPVITIEVDPASTAAFLELFNGETMLLTAHTSDSGHTWAAMQGLASAPKAFTVGSGVAYAGDTSSPGAWAQSSFAPTSPNYRADIGVKVGSVPAVTSSATIYLRGGDGVDTGYTVVYNAFSGAWTLQRRDNGTNLTIVSVTNKLAANTTGTMSLILDGDQLTFYVMGALVGTYTDKTYAAAGKLGMKMTGGSTAPTSGGVIADISISYLR